MIKVPSSSGIKRKHGRSAKDCIKIEDESEPLYYTSKYEKDEQ